MSGSVWAHGRGASVVRHGCLHAEEEAVASTLSAAQSVLDRGTGALVDLEKIHWAALDPDADVEVLAHQLALLLESARVRNSADSKFVDAATICINLLVAKVRSLDKTMASMAKTMESMAEKIASMEKELGALALSREKVLLGQAAYIVDLAAASYVFATPTPKLTTLPQLHSYRTDGSLSEQQEERFDRFMVFLGKQGWKLETLNATTRALRTARSGAAHGEPTEQASVTEDSLLEWSGRHLDPVAAERFKLLLPLIRLLTEPEKPLILRSNLRTEI